MPAPPTPWELTGNSNIGGGFLGSTDGEPLVIKTNGKEALRVDPAGKVGIGTPVPVSVLEATVPAPGTVGPSLTLTNPGGGLNAAAAIDFNTFRSSAGTYNPSSRVEGVDDGNFANDLVFLSNNPGAPNHGLVEIMRVKSGVATGTLGPSLTLTNHGGGANAAAAIDFNTFSPSAAGAYNPSSRIEGVDDGNFANDIVFLSNNPGAPNNGLVEIMRITPSGVKVILGGARGAADAVFGTSVGGRGLYGHSSIQAGVVGESDHSIGVLGNSEENDAVHGNSNSTVAAGVSGFNVRTSAPSGPGVFGHSGWGSGVVGDSDHYVGVFGVSHDPAQAGVCGHNPGGLAGFFNGNVTVTGDISLPGADCAEDFDVACSEHAEPGTVMIINPEGALEPSREAYDKKVAGVVSGAGELRPGIVLDQRQSCYSRTPLALVGKVYCKVDACYSPIEVGDLLTTSATPGHAMKAGDPLKAFGAVIGKALRPLRAGQGLLPILIALQ